mmetsp:Transcript_38723/g.111924  ORF Transcript_38723/g.111924 Transcript_38723/m.111924 type:complete len:204 (-) Transcript_38723:201-812(-)
MPPTTTTCMTATRLRGCTMRRTRNRSACRWHHRTTPSRRTPRYWNARRWRSRAAADTEASGKVDKGMAAESSSRLRATGTRASSKTREHTAAAFSPRPMARCTTASGIGTRSMVTESTSMPMAPCTRVNGTRTRSPAAAPKGGPMELGMRASFCTVPNMASACTSPARAFNTRGSLGMIAWTAMVATASLAGASTLVSGGWAT